MRNCPFLLDFLLLTENYQEFSVTHYQEDKKLAKLSRKLILSIPELLLIVTSSPGLLKEGEEPVTEGEDAVETRALKGCVRIGDLADGLLLSGDKELEMLVLCTDKPTVYMLQNVKDKFEELLTVSGGRGLLTVHRGMGLMAVYFGVGKRWRLEPLNDRFCKSVV